MRIGLGLHITGLRAGGEAAPFTPASLFASGEEGIWLEPSPSTCFTDTGGTTAASVGDPVARINDSSGNGNNATQATLASRPILRQTGGGLYYLEFDGTDDFMEVAAFVQQDTGSLYASSQSVNAIQNSFFLASQFDNVTPERVAQYGRLDPTASNNIVTVAFDSTTGIFTDVSGTAPTVSTPFVSSCVISSGSVESFFNGAGNGASTGPASFRTDAQPLFLGSNYQNTAVGSGFLDGDIFGVVLLDRPPSGTERANLESYVANLAGVTL